MAAGEELEFCQRALLGGYGLFLQSEGSQFCILGHVKAGVVVALRSSMEWKALGCASVSMRYLKNRKYPGWLGWVHALARCYRGTILNRGLINSRGILGAHDARSNGKTFSRGTRTYCNRGRRLK